MNASGIEIIIALLSGFVAGSISNFVGQWQDSFGHKARENTEARAGVLPLVEVSYRAETLCDLAKEASAHAVLMPRIIDLAHDIALARANFDLVLHWSRRDALKELGCCLAQQCMEVTALASCSQEKLGDRAGEFQANVESARVKFLAELTQDIRPVLPRPTRRERRQYKRRAVKSVNSAAQAEPTPVSADSSAEKVTR